jgi:lia operon protein LiaG
MFKGKNVKKISLGLAVVMVVSFGIAGLLFKANGFDETFLSEKQVNIDSQKSTDVVGVTSINVAAVDANIRVIPTDANTITTHLYGSARSGRGNPQLAQNLDGGKLSIEVKQPTILFINIGFSERNLKLDVYVPKGYAKALNVNSTAAPISVSGFNLSSFSCSSVSGDIDILSVSSKDSNCGTTSGTFTARGWIGALKVHSVSGGINITEAKLTDNITADTVSGDVAVVLPQDAQFSVKFNTISGNVSSNFAMTLSSSDQGRVRGGTVGKNGKDISIQTVSGNASVNK